MAASAAPGTATSPGASRPPSPLRTMAARSRGGAPGVTTAAPAVSASRSTRGSPPSRRCSSAEMRGPLRPLATEMVHRLDRVREWLETQQRAQVVTEVQVTAHRDEADRRVVRLQVVRERVSGVPAEPGTPARVQVVPFDGEPFEEDRLVVGGQGGGERDGVRRAEAVRALAHGRGGTLLAGVREREVGRRIGELDAKR